MGLLAGNKARHVARVDALEIASVLLRYPSEELIGALDAVGEVLGGIKGDAARATEGFLEHLRRTPLLELQRSYCEAFDFDRRASLHLSWYQYGDRRQRGVVLLRLKRAYQAHGFDADEGELPDHLALMLEFATRAPDGAGLALLQQWRASIELVRGALHERGRAWAPVLDLVIDQMPRLTGDVRAQIQQLLTDGPPGEDVGLEPFGDPGSTVITAQSEGACQ